MQCDNLSGIIPDRLSHMISAPLLQKDLTFHPVEGVWSGWVEETGGVIS